MGSVGVPEASWGAGSIQPAPSRVSIGCQKEWKERYKQEKQQMEQEGVSANGLISDSRSEEPQGKADQTPALGIVHSGLLSPHPPSPSTQGDTGQRSDTRRYVPWKQGKTGPSPASSVTPGT